MSSSAAAAGCAKARATADTVRSAPAVMDRCLLRWARRRTGSPPRWRHPRLDAVTDRRSDRRLLPLRRIRSRCCFIPANLGVSPSSPATSSLRRVAEVGGTARTCAHGYGAGWPNTGSAKRTSMNVRGRPSPAADRTFPSGIATRQLDHCARNALICWPICMSGLNRPFIHLVLAVLEVPRR